MNELFTAATGYKADPLHFAMLDLYVRAGAEGDILEQIADMSTFYPEPDLAEVGFVVVWDAMLKG
jgi:hypothetical protein